MFEHDKTILIVKTDGTFGHGIKPKKPIKYAFPQIYSHMEPYKPGYPGLSLHNMDC